MLENSIFGLPKVALIRCRFWDDECVIYNQLTGETHLVDGMGAEFFKLISEKSSTRAQLLENIQSVFELETDSEMEGLLDNLILEYQKLGLVEVTEKHS
jgi:PqqD family protein of HPr-rel-A system